MDLGQLIFERRDILKKLLGLFICILFLTGCTVNYDVTIDEDSFDESISLSFLKSQTSYNDLLVYKNDETPINVHGDENKFYDSQITENFNNYVLTYKYKHDMNSINDAYFIKNCYPNFSLVNSDQMIRISSGNQFMCLNGDDGLSADSVSITIKTDMKVISNNADKVSGNSYTWNIDETNYDNKPINLVIQRDMNVQDIIVENDSSFTLIFVVITVLVLLLVIFMVIRLKAKKNNAI